MKIVVIDGTNLAGTKLVERLRQKGHEVVATPAGSHVDAASRQALADAQVIVDMARPRSRENREVIAFFTMAGRLPTSAARQHSGAIQGKIWRGPASPERRLIPPPAKYNKEYDDDH